MKAPLSWLRQYVKDIPATSVVAERLAIVGTEVERVIHTGVPLSRNGHAYDNGHDPSDCFRVGRVVQFEQHPNADRLRLCTIDVGEATPRQIICGASNFSQGDTVAVALPGAVMPDGTVLEPATLRGVESFGMMLSERELELSTDHNGIMILPKGMEVGSRLADHIPLSDEILELEITSNRPDCLGIYGIARELSAAFHLPLEDVFAEDAPAGGSGSVSDVVTVSVADGDLCPRYMARAFVDVAVGDSPPWLKARLAAVGMRSINNVVDVTNYVMMLTGQPLHAFDADAIEGATLTVRRAAQGEQVTTLDDVERTLTPEMLVIADAKSVGVIAGIMGAAHVEVGEATTRIVLEAASFNGTSVMTTSAALGIRTESSSRFEKGLDPYNPEIALRYASRMLVELCGATMVPGTIDVGGEDLPALPVIEFPLSCVDETLGIEVPVSALETILPDLGYSIGARIAGDDIDQSIWSIGVPHWRMYDTTRPIDLVEEIARIHGLEKIPAQMPAHRSTDGGLTAAQTLQRVLEDACAGMGLREVVTYSLVSHDDNDWFGSGDTQAVVLNNPMTVEHAELRTDLVGCLLGVVARNQALGSASTNVFEIGRVFHALPDGASEVLGDDGLPSFAREERMLGLCCSGQLFGGRFDAAGIDADFGAVVGMVESLALRAGLALTVAAPATPAPWMHPGRCATVWAGGEAVGSVAEVHPNTLKRLGIRGTACAAELKMSAFELVADIVSTYTPFSEFPPVRQDIALVVANGVTAGSLLETVRDVGGTELESVHVFDRYAGEPIPEGSYSLALRLSFRSADRTLTDADVATMRNAIVEQLAAKHSARLRDGE